MDSSLTEQTVDKPSSEDEKDMQDSVKLPNNPEEEEKDDLALGIFRKP